MWKLVKVLQKVLSTHCVILHTVYKYMKVNSCSPMPIRQSMLFCWEPIHANRCKVSVPQDAPNIKHNICLPIVLEDLSEHHCLAACMENKPIDVNLIWYWAGDQSPATNFFALFCLATKGIMGVNGLWATYRILCDGRRMVFSAFPPFVLTISLAFPWLSPCFFPVFPSVSLAFPLFFSSFP